MLGPLCRAHADSGRSISVGGPLPVSLIIHLPIVKNLLWMEWCHLYSPQLINSAVVAVVTGGDFFLYCSSSYCTEGHLTRMLFYLALPMQLRHDMMSLCLATFLGLTLTRAQRARYLANFLPNGNLVSPVPKVLEVTGTQWQRDKNVLSVAPWSATVASDTPVYFSGASSLTDPVPLPRMSPQWLIMMMGWKRRSPSTSRGTVLLINLCSRAPSISFYPTDRPGLVWDFVPFLRTFCPIPLPSLLFSWEHSSNKSGMPRLHAVRKEWGNVWKTHVV